MIKGESITPDTRITKIECNLGKLEFGNYDRKFVAAVRQGHLDEIADEQNELLANYLYSESHKANVRP